MRLDLFLSNSGIVKRRAIARQICESGKVTINDNVSKPGKDVDIGDKIGVKLPSGYKLIEITGLPMKSIPKKEGINYYNIIEFQPRERRRE